MIDPPEPLSPYIAGATFGIACCVVQWLIKRVRFWLKARSDR